MIVFPAIDLRSGRCVRLLQGQPDAETVYSDDPVAVAQRWEAEGAQWLHVVNLDGAFGHDSPNPAMVKRIIQAVDVPVQFGGGLRTFEDIEEAMGWGVARVILGTVAVRDPDMVSLAVKKFGAESIVLGVDAREGYVATHGWQEVSEVEAVDLALDMLLRGIQRVVYTDIARDGMLTGVNLTATAKMARRTGLYVIASGGVSSLDDVHRLKALEPLGIEGVIIGRALYTGAIKLKDALGIASAED